MQKIRVFEDRSVLIRGFLFKIFYGFNKLLSPRSHEPAGLEIRGIGRMLMVMVAIDNYFWSYCIGAKLGKKHINIKKREAFAEKREK